jgi:hypothetical protein
LESSESGRLAESRPSSLPTDPTSGTDPKAHAQREGPTPRPTRSLEQTPNRSPRPDRESSLEPSARRPRDQGKRADEAPAVGGDPIAGEASPPRDLDPLAKSRSLDPERSFDLRRGEPPIREICPSAS